MALPLLLLRQFTLTALKGILSLLIREDTHMDEIAAKPTRQTDGSAGTPPLKVYWQPGCSSCLKTKEFLIANGVEFISVAVTRQRLRRRRIVHAESPENPLRS